MHTAQIGISSALNFWGLQVQHRMMPPKSFNLSSARAKYEFIKDLKRLYKVWVIFTDIDIVFFIIFLYFSVFCTNTSFWNLSKQSSF